MTNFRNFKVLLLAMFFGCTRNTSTILPSVELTHFENYHCWPYNVSVFSTGPVTVDSLFYTYPLKSYFGDNPKYEVATWAEYSNIDTTVWYGMDKTLSQCDQNIELYNHLLEGREVYFAGSYQYFKNLQGERRRTFEVVLFLDLSSKKLHVFKDINKVY
jgi:hypothetical protein